MKKLLLLLVCCLTVLTLAGCDSTVGTWKFVEKTNLLGIVTKAGENDITEDYLVIVFEKDGTGTFTQKDTKLTLAFNWVEEDNLIKVTGTLVNFEAKIETGYLLFDYAGSSYKMKK